MRSLRREPPLTRPAPAAPRDPSPSIWAYRLHRMWLTPLYRRLMRVGLPAAIGVVAVVWYVADDARLREIVDRAAEIRRMIEERPEFMVHMVAVEGTGEELAQAVREAMPLRLPISSFDLELETLRAQAELLDAVKRARLRIRPGGVLEVQIEERVPAVLWRTAAGLILLDAEGARVAMAVSRKEWPALPVIAGDGADAAVPEAMALLAAAQPLAERLRGLVRMGERRWDLVLDRDQRILLPERDAFPALERLIVLNEARDLLSRDVTLVDLRNPHRPTLRLSGNAVAELHRVRGDEAGVTSQ